MPKLSSAPLMSKIFARATAPEYRMVGSMVMTYAIRNITENRRMVKVS